eukprot:TRINITY_DN3702_c0_g5_i1.p1 TRINITY_DN3702_c0_g5~~TRINITY_DN3702_c0_g5_i1.p1  ORF type:complete len:488 (-),score=114.92 TRINITY_DN3702_c0_g5_i1:73-1536(-)
MTLQGAIVGALISMFLIAVPANAQETTAPPEDALGFPGSEDELSPADFEAPIPSNGGNAQDIMIETGKEAEEREEGERQFEIAECTFDAGLATFFLMRAGLEINGASHSCPEDENADCAMEVSGVISSFADTASFLSGVADTCPPKEGTVEMKCAMAITKLVGAVGEIAAAGAGMSVDCDPEEIRKAEHEIKAGTQVQRRLQVTQTAVTQTAVTQTAAEKEKEEEEEKRERSAEIAECVCDTGSATFLLGYAGLEITGSTKTCPTGKEGQQQCAAQVSGALASFGFVSTYLSAAAAECGTTANPRAECAADISKLVASLSEVASAASQMSKVCVQSALHAPPEAEGGEEAGEWEEPPQWVDSLEDNAPNMDANVRRLQTSGADSELIADERAILLKVLAKGGKWGPEEKESMDAMVKKHGLGKRVNISNEPLSVRAKQMKELAEKWRKKLAKLEAAAQAKANSMSATQPPAANAKVPVPAAVPPVYQ